MTIMPPISDIKGFSTTHVVQLFCLIIIFAVLVLLSSGPLQCYDVWWHLASGRWMWEHGRILTSDPFSFTYKQQPWIDHSWLYQLVLYKIYSLADIRGIIIFRIFLVLSVGLLLFVTARIKGAGFTEALLAPLFFASISFTRFFDRPHLVVFLLAASMALLLELYFIRKDVLYLLAASVVQAVWVNVHASYVIGIMLVCIVAVREFLSVLVEYAHCSDRQVLTRKIIKAPLLYTVPAVLLISFFCTPYGIEHIKFVLFSHTGSSADATRHILEWYRLSWRAFFFFDPASVTGQIALFFWLNLAVVFLSFKQGYFSEGTGHLMLLIAMCGLTLKYGRFAALSSVLLVPYLVKGISGFVFYLRWTFIIFVVLFILTNPVAARFKRPDMFKEINYGQYPEAVAGFIKRHNLKGNLLNAYPFGGYYDFQLFPGCKVAIDGRTPTVFPAEFYWYYRHISRDRTVLMNFLDEYSPDMISMSLKDNINKLLSGMDKWGMVFSGSRAALFMPVRKAEDQGFLIYKAYRPWENIADYVDDLNGTAVDKLGKEFKALLSEDPSNYRVILDTGIFYARARKDYDRALSCYKKAVAIYPMGRASYYNAALACEKSDKWQEALEWTESGLKWFRHDPDLLVHKGYALVHLKMYDEALDYFQEYLEVRRDKAKYDFYKYFAIALYRTGNAQDALTNFRKAEVFLRDEPEEEAVIAYNMAICHAWLRDYDKAVESCGKAVEFDASKELYRNYLNKYEKRLRYSQ